MSEPTGVRGWLLVLCLLLVVWQPISFGLAASNALGRLAFRGVPLALVLAARVIITALGIAAGLTLLARRPGAVALAKLSLVASAATDVFVYTTRYFPNSRMPGDTGIPLAASLAYYTIWLTYLVRSKRVRNTFEV